MPSRPLNSDRGRTGRFAPMKYADIVVNVPTHSPYIRSVRRVNGRAARRGGEIGASSLPVGEEGALPTPYSWIDQAFTYSLRPSHEASAEIGQLVWVPFGARRLQGIIVGLNETTTLGVTRPVEAIAETRPFLSSSQIQLARWIANRYLAPLSECIWLLLPPGIEEKVETIYQPGRDLVVPDNLSEKEKEVLGLLKTSSGIKATRLPSPLRSAAESLVQKGLLTKHVHVRPPRAKPRFVKTVRLTIEAPQFEAAVGSLTRRVLRGSVRERLMSVLDLLKREGGSAWINVVYAATGATSSDLYRLERAGILKLESEEALRDPLGGSKFTPVFPHHLTVEQASVFGKIAHGLDADMPSIHLLHGVTGSGKTEIYLNSIERVLNAGRQAIALVPEIALTPQTIKRFGARFGSRIGVIHSDLSYGERYDTWRRARDGKLDVIIGPRSALFAPLPRLGLIVIDEEHEPSYKQESEAGTLHLPLYHTREVALELARLNRATVIMGSATPDVETYFRAKQGEFELLELPNRLVAHGTAAGPAPYQDLPPVEIVDLRAELRSGNRSIFSRSLSQAISAALAGGEQVILFLNRRGTATSVLCRSCGRPLKCPRCNNPFTLHQFGPEAPKELICHHCGNRGHIPLLCPNCGSNRVRALGLGTERLEQAVKENWPGTRTLRWDRDVIRGKQTHERILEAFTNGEADVLIGTQMIAKGLDLPRVTLVGVMNADTALNLPDFRSSERTFQLLTQVAGRAGRSALGGKVIIQTYYPEHYAVTAAARHDYKGFYEEELRFRREASYPPFRPFARLLYVGATEEKARESAALLASTLQERIRRRGLPDVEIIGPAPAFFSKWGGRYRYHMFLRGVDARTLLADSPLPPGWRIDIDPMNVL